MRPSRFVEEHEGDGAPDRFRELAASRADVAWRRSDQAGDVGFPDIRMSMRMHSLIVVEEETPRGAGEIRLAAAVGRGR